MKRKLLKHYWAAHHASRQHVYRRPYILPVLGLLAGVAIIGGVLISRPNHTLRPSDSHVVFLSDNGDRQTLNTKAETVGDLVKKLPLKLIAEDVVEPSLDTPIVQDNFRINVYRARPVTVMAEDSGSKSVAITAQRSPRVVAEQAGTVVYPEDNVSFAPGSIRENIIGEKVVIDRATPVQFSLYGNDLTVRTHTATVGELLKEKQVKLTPDDTLIPAAETPITPNLVVRVVRNGIQVTTVEEVVAAPIEYVNDASLSLGATAVRQAGSPGKRVVTYQVVTENGIVVSRTILQQTVTVQPVPRVVARGTIVYVSGNKTSLMAAAGIRASDYGYVDFIVSHESGWRVTAQNASGAYGLCQALPGSKMASAGSDWQGNPVTQLRWCNGYAMSRYGSWAAAYNFWVSRHYW